MYIAKIQVVLKESVLDPQGSTVKKVLSEVGEKSVRDVRVGKYIELKIDAPNEEAAKKDVERLCDKILVNHVIETYSLNIQKI
ncbi:phosphoribosylformylglycinamidine synthase, purS protein [Leptospira weilii str. 2006001853]|uniref:Phosphoribosylformylglycinamidine synthase subunit PurS n=4 Tax=Leptospira weilii TaxID=28184 RepID=A0A828Z1R0_9LEPT|nr:phosphoribosylformylglycinamidine synthase subunit PurS [Leptospira weilii]EMM73435.1 phosphoribosylformylglycinamidine synthase, purS protein [Leptospira weilii str. 2006001855]EMY16033.1 phosphoribosylformylglycinamidine synthase, purS protein [Leptospira weilii str. Ecochallenge]EKR65177.1 phosphoribosylformylglycinamidine synthase, purS protein [Leptospira weilii str. 2006001853]EMN46106.1 phosphoribosylformylglycinamidine synthase, purS protein [Leptospira weilii str. LNT 1234]EMN88075